MRKTVAKRLRKQAIKECGVGNTSTQVMYDELKREHGKPAPVKLKDKRSKRQKRLDAQKQQP